MDWITIESRWEEFELDARQQWAKLSEEQLHGTRGKREHLSRRVQEAYSLSRQEAERQISEWLARQAAKAAP